MGGTPLIHKMALYNTNQECQLWSDKLNDIYKHANYHYFCANEIYKED